MDLLNRLLMSMLFLRYDTHREYSDPSVRLYLDSRRSKVVRRCTGSLSDWSLRHSLEVGAAGSQASGLVSTKTLIGGL